MAVLMVFDLMMFALMIVCLNDGYFNDDLFKLCVLMMVGAMVNTLMMFVFLFF